MSRCSSVWPRGSVASSLRKAAVAAALPIPPPPPPIAWRPPLPPPVDASPLGELTLQLPYPFSPAEPYAVQIADLAVCIVENTARTDDVVIGLDLAHAPARVDGPVWASVQLLSSVLQRRTGKSALPFIEREVSLVTPHTIIRVGNKKRKLGRSRSRLRFQYVFDSWNAMEP